MPASSFLNFSSTQQKIERISTSTGRSDDSSISLLAAFWCWAGRWLDGDGSACSRGWRRVRQRGGVPAQGFCHWGGKVWPRLEDHPTKKQQAKQKWHLMTNNFKNYVCDLTGFRETVGMKLGWWLSVMEPQSRRRTAQMWNLANIRVNVLFVFKCWGNIRF